ncbi:MAG: NAD(P)H-dependent oxidoreductase [Bacteroidota bacterium]
MDLVQQLNWRYATKRMTGQKVPKEKLDNIMEAIRLSASSMGLQPYHVLVIEDAELRKKMSAVAYKQPQITEASHLLLFAVWDSITKQRMDDFFNQVAEVRGVSIDTQKQYREMLEGKLKRETPEETFQWLARQAYIALGTGLSAAALQEVDATPMEGFDNKGMDELLGLKEKGLRSMAILALGYRDAANDKLLGAKKVRRNKEQFFIHMN